MSKLLRACRCSRARAAFSLAELVVALAVSSILVAGAGVVLTSTVHSAEVSGGAAAHTAAVRSALSMIAADAAVATSINTATPRELALVVPDRTGDALPETIRYAWSGSSGAPLFRSVNGVSSQILADVRDLDLAATLRPGPTRTTVSGQTLAEYTTTAPSQGYTFGYDWQVAVSVRPTLPVNCTAFSLSSVSFQLERSGGGTRTVAVEVRDVLASGEPGTQILASANASSSALGTSMQWIEFPTTVGPLASTASLCIIIRGVSTESGNTAKLATVTSEPSPGNLIVWSKRNAADAWSAPSPPIAVPIRLTGSYTTKTEQ